LPLILKSRKEKQNFSGTEGLRCRWQSITNPNREGETIMANNQQGKSSGSGGRSKSGGSSSKNNNPSGKNQYTSGRSSSSSSREDSDRNR
jgi:hypothetical protein